MDLIARAPIMAKFLDIVAKCIIKAPFGWILPLAWHVWACNRLTKKRKRKFPKYILDQVDTYQKANLALLLNTFDRNFKECSHEESLKENINQSFVCTKKDLGDSR
jgi:hypothetical protein